MADTSENKKSRRKVASPIGRGYVIAPGPGRPKGRLNKFTSLKDAFLQAFEATGGAQGLIDWVNKHPSNKADFYKMITKMLPANVSVDHQGDITVVISDKYVPKNNGQNS